MPAAARVGDTISHGGSITSGALKVQTNGLAAARLGDAVSCDIHGAQTIDSGSANVVCEGAPRARVGDVTTCTPPATITSGSANVEIN